MYIRCIDCLDLPKIFISEIALSQREIVYIISMEFMDLHKN